MQKNNIGFFMSTRKNCLCGSELKHSFSYNSSDHENEFWFAPRKSFKFEGNQLILSYIMNSNSDLESTNFDIIIDCDNGSCDIVTDGSRNLIASQFNLEVQRKLCIIAYKYCNNLDCTFRINIYTFPFAFQFFWENGIVTSGLYHETFSIVDGKNSYVIDNDYLLNISKFYTHNKNEPLNKEIFNMDLEKFLAIPFNREDILKKIKKLAIFS